LLETVVIADSLGSVNQYGKNSLLVCQMVMSPGIQTEVGVDATVAKVLSTYLNQHTGLWVTPLSAFHKGVGNQSWTYGHSVRLYTEVPTKTEKQVCG
jgi:hypothetical protein